jgi:exosome complex RNA-binding protein Rrp4
LEKLGEIFAFEMCVGYNGKVFIKSERPVDTILILNSLQTVSDMIMQNQEIGDYSGYKNAAVRAKVDSIINSLQSKQKKQKK